MVDGSSNTSGSNFYKPVDGIKNLDLPNSPNTRIVTLMKESSKNSPIIFRSSQAHHHSPNPKHNDERYQDNQNYACVGTFPTTLIKVKSLDSSDISDREFNAAPRFTQGISTHYGLLNSPVNNAAYIQEEGNEGGSSNCMDYDTFNKESIPNILSSTSRDLKISPFAQIQPPGKHINRHVSNHDIIKIVNPSGAPGVQRNAGTSNMLYN